MCVPVKLCVQSLLHAFVYKYTTNVPNFVILSILLSYFFTFFVCVLYLCTLWKFPNCVCSQLTMSKKMGIVALLNSSSGIRVISSIGPTTPGIKQILWLPARCIHKCIWRAHISHTHTCVQYNSHTYISHSIQCYSYYCPSVSGAPASLGPASWKVSSALIGHKRQSAKQVFILC